MEKINSIEMVRKIRDKQYEETKNMSHKELLEYYKFKGKKALLSLQGHISATQTPHSSQ
jgi:hypothetical protein